MNKSINLKNEMGKKFNNTFNLNQLSVTSSEFMTEILNNKFNKMIGGNNICEKIFNAFNNNNLELALYIIKENKCSYNSQDKNGNTILHHLIMNNVENKECCECIDKILQLENVNEFINIQNNLGQTPMLLTVLNDDNDTANKLEKVGADKSIQDNNGNFIQSEDELLENENSESFNDVKKIINIFNFNINTTEKDSTSLNLNTNNSHQTYIENTDDFINNIKSKIYNPTKILSNSNNKNNIKHEENEDLNTDKFISMLNSDGNMSYFNYDSMEDDTDKFITILKNKYSYPEITSKKNLNNNKILIDDLKNKTTSDSLNDSITSPMETNLNLQNLVNETTSDSKNDSITSPIETNLNLQNLVNETTSDSLIDKNDSITSPIETNLNLLNETTSEDETFLKNNKQEIMSDTSVLTNDINTMIEKLANESTSDESVNKKGNNIFYKSKDNKFKIVDSSEIDTNTLIKAIDNIDIKKEKFTNDHQMMGGSKQKIMGFRNINFDSEIINNDNLNYDLLYNTDSEFGNSNNELSRMIQNQREKLHQEVLDMIISMLNKSILMHDNAPIEANEKNAKLIKAYIYRIISEKNPQMGGLDKIMTFKAMSENEIINLVKKMPDLDELEKSIQKHIEKKKADKIDLSDTMESESNNESKNKKTVKKVSKATKTVKSTKITKEKKPVKKSSKTTKKSSKK